ncbi:hypothetical protein [Dehalococcoides mccartyi]|uniref:Uncharacterized protein n=1 Tax=Dehalococcoides mccartyi (strain ATCC BAA-2266 / KCTC 15142 / 195) TaxID=243164 RepID=Q3Z9R8_DEHM1|nr:hypothetical protein [Dehalococcoides mccartyi]AAW39820.1 hypothetical protein DET0893 [Dehalococcoides mccartyi 195]AAW40409.1 hypothetical protein DET0283 [Dehalococcoides mccartyi 195]AAW40456.1 hypothetical protein DET0260 [Dehalococcoides mccartyi 195]
MKKFIIAVSMFVMSVLIGPGTILASDITDAIYRADIRATNSSYTAMKVSAPFTWSTQSLLDGYYINSGFTNLALRDSIGNDIPFMPGQGSDPWIMWIDQIAQNSVLNYSLYTGGETAMGGKLAYFPDTAGMSVVDSASLELGSDFEIELSGYINTSSGTSKLIIDKGGAYICYPNNAGEIVALIGSAANISQATYYSATTSRVYGANWYGQTFIPISDIYVNSITLWCQKILAPSGNFNVYIYAVSGGVPTGTALATGSISASTISGSAGAQTFYLSQSAKLSSGTSYALAFSCPTGDASNYIKVWSENSDAYASGTKCSSSDSGVTWSADSYDYYFVVGGYTPAVTLTATGIISSDHTVKTVLSGGTFSLYVDNILADSAAYAGSITDNANNWVIGANGSMPYLYYAKITIGGVLKGSWEWQYATTFTDLSGNSNDATPSFRTTTTDADVSAAIISYNAYNLSALVVSGDDKGIQIIDDDEISDTPAGFFGALDPDRLEFLSPINEIISEAGIPLEFVWYPFIFGGGAAITMISFGVTRKLLPCIIAGGIWTGFLSAALGADLWTVLPFVVVAATELVNRKTVSL